MPNGFIRRLKKLKLRNVAFTGIPMNEGAFITGTFMKSLEQLNTEGKPFAGYANFDECVQKNKDKSDPKAYCASIMRKVEGKGDGIMTEETKAVEPEKVEIKDFSKDIEKIKESLKSLSETVDSIIKQNAAESELKTKVESLETEIKSLKAEVDKPILKARAAETEVKAEAETEERKSLLSTV